VKGRVVVASNMKNASHRMRFACSCEPGLEGMTAKTENTPMGACFWCSP